MLVVRLALAGDVTAVRDCLASAFEPYRSSYTERALADTVPAPDDLRRRMEEGSVFVAEEAGAIVGTIAAAEVEPRHGHLRGMGVVPSAQGRGVAARLLRRAIDELHAAGCALVTLDTTGPLVRAMKFYESHGFARTGRVRDFFGMPLHEYARTLDADVVVREARAEDQPAIVRVINAAYVVEREFVSGERLSEAQLREYFGRGTFLVGARGGEPSACVFVQSKPDGRAYLGLLAVDPASQRTGLGALMMAAAERWCRRAGARAIDILVVNLRTELPPFYASRGFVPDGTAPFVDPRQLKPLHFIKMTLPIA